jgi:hypothetical protein
MPLQKYGPIDMSDIATEFKRPTPFKNIRLGDYYKEMGSRPDGSGGTYYQPLDTSVNLTVPFGPEGNPIKMSDFYGAAWYQGTFSATGYGETATQYANADNAYLTWSISNCSSPFINVTVGGRTTSIVGNGVSYSTGGTYHIGSVNSSASIRLTYTDCRGTWNETITVYYGGAGTSFSINLATSTPDNKSLRI